MMIFTVPMMSIDNTYNTEELRAFDERVAQAGNQMRLAHAWRAEQQDVGTLLEPAVAFGKRSDVFLI